AASSESGPPPSPSRPPTRTAPPAASQGQAGGSRREAAPSRQPPEAAPSASGPPPSPPRPPAAAAPPAAPFRPSASPGGGGGSPRPAGPPEAPARPTPPEPAAGNTTPTRTPPVRPGKVPADLWPRILARLREKNKSLQAILADARLAELGEERLVLAFPESYNWHREKTLESRALLEQVCSAVLERPVRVECVLGGQPPASAQDEHQALVQRASQLFSGRIMEE
ncbi:MAG TPA: hypothetical protein VNO81_03675, partial [Candidatus Nitrosotenuis sp.]|nr:hypothetical protein [Candidatus Nitrosotenuis sp.]